MDFNFKLRAKKMFFMQTKFQCWHATRKYEYSRLIVLLTVASTIKNIIANHFMGNIDRLNHFWIKQS